MKLKFKVLKALDIAGLQILDPVVRLCCGEDPRAQLRRIGLYIGVPAATFALFLLAWNWVGPRHTTKSGEVPTPGVVLDAAEGILTFHEREQVKLADYYREGPERESVLAAVEARLAELGPLAAEAAAAVTKVEAEARERMNAALAPANDAYRDRRLAIAAAEKERQAALLALAEQASSTELIKALDTEAATADDEAEEIAQLRDARQDIQNRSDPELTAARLASNRIAEELQFLRKRRDLLTTENLSLKLATLDGQITEAEYAVAAATTAADRLQLTRSLVNLRNTREQSAGTAYTPASTLPAQIKRSLVCVFTGFVVASLIAIPIGILCGISPVFMAALTPLISLFKPVSPIVWLPIIFIIVGGFIPDPTDSGLLDFFNLVPGLRGLDVNPAFLASALTVAMCSLWPTLVNTALGVAAVDRDHLNVARVLQLGVFARLVRIIIPSALPLIFAGLRISLGVGWMVLIAAELLSSSEGIGKYVWDMFNNGSSQTFAQMFVVVFVVGVIGLALDRIMIVFQRLVSFDGAPTSI